jgi:hypothetical protein
LTAYKEATHMNHDISEQDENRALDRLTTEWGDEYEIYITGGQWQAWARGAPPEDMLDASTPDELNAKIAADSAQRGRSTS